MDRVLTGHYSTLISSVRIKYNSGERLAGLYVGFEQKSIISNLDFVFESPPQIDTSPTKINADSHSNYGNELIKK